MKNNPLKKLLFIQSVNSSFVRNDLDILKAHFAITKFHYKADKAVIKNLIDQLKLLFWLLQNIWNTKVIIIWFAGYHSLLPVALAKLLGKKSFIIIGGYDVASIPEINYGFSNTAIRKFFSFNSIKWATCNLAVSEFLKDEVETKVKDALVKVLYTAHSEQSFFPNRQSKENMVITVGAGDTIERIKLKGIDFLIKVAALLPEFKFVIIGMGENAKRLLGNLPKNIQVEGRVDDDTLLKYYQRAKVYAQFSLREGLPGAVCEAMLCECIAVGSNNGGIPIAIGDSGFILKEYNEKKAADLINNALQAPNELGKKARQRIIDNFSFNRRRDELLDLLKN